MAELAIDHLSRREQFMLTLAHTALKAHGGDDYANRTINYIVRTADDLEPVKRRAAIQARRQQGAEE